MATAGLLDIIFITGPKLTSRTPLENSLLLDLTLSSLSGPLLLFLVPSPSGALLRLLLLRFFLVILLLDQ